MNENESVPSAAASGRAPHTRQYRALMTAAAVMTFLLVATGGVVCFTDASQGCPDWPACYGRLVPPMRLDSILEYTHRVVAALTTPLVLAAAVVGWRKYRRVRWVSRPLGLSVLLLLVVIVFGAMVVLRGLGTFLATLDVVSALLSLTLVLSATVAAFLHDTQAGYSDRFSVRDPFSRLVMVTCGVAFLVLASGVAAAEDGSPVRCLGWPLVVHYQNELQIARLALAGVGSILVVAVVVQARRTQGHRPQVRRVAAVMGLAFAAELAVGVLLVVSAPTLWLLVSYVLAAAAFWSLLVCLLVLVALERVGEGGRDSGNT